MPFRLVNTDVSVELKLHLQIQALLKMEALQAFQSWVTIYQLAGRNTEQPLGRHIELRLQRFFITCVLTSYVHYCRMEEGSGVHKVLVGKPEGKRPLGRPRRRWEDNIKIYLEEVGRGCGDWMELAKDRDRWRALVSTVMNFRVP